MTPRISWWNYITDNKKWLQLFTLTTGSWRRTVTELQHMDYAKVWSIKIDGRLPPPSPLGSHMAPKCCDIYIKVYINPLQNWMRSLPDTSTLHCNENPQTLTTWPCTLSNWQYIIEFELLCHLITPDLSKDIRHYIRRHQHSHQIHVLDDDDDVGKIKEVWFVLFNDTWSQ